MIKILKGIEVGSSFTTLGDNMLWFLEIFLLWNTVILCKSSFWNVLLGCESWHYQNRLDSPFLVGCCIWWKKMWKYDSWLLGNNDNLLGFCDLWPVWFELKKAQNESEWKWVRSAVESGLHFASYASYSALIIHISNIQRTKKYSTGMYYHFLHSEQENPLGAISYSNFKSQDSFR